MVLLICIVHVNINIHSLHLKLQHLQFELVLVNNILAVIYMCQKCLAIQEQQHFPPITESLKLKTSAV